MQVKIHSASKWFMRLKLPSNHIKPTDWPLALSGLPDGS